MDSKYCFLYVLLPHLKSLKEHDVSIEYQREVYDETRLKNILVVLKHPPEVLVCVCRVQIPRSFVLAEHAGDIEGRTELQGL